MLFIAHELLKDDFFPAVETWTSASSGIRRVDSLFRVDPGCGYPQAATHLTAFSAVLFGQLACRLQGIALFTEVHASYKGCCGPQKLDRSIRYNPGGSAPSPPGFFEVWLRRSMCSRKKRPGALGAARARSVIDAPSARLSLVG